MPRTSTLESPGCPNLRAITFDSLGLIKVIEARGEGKSAPEVVERWGESDSSNSVLAVSLVDSAVDPLLGIARKSGQIDVLSPIDGDIRVSIPNNSQTDTRSEDNAIVGLHLFKQPRSQSHSRSLSLLACTNKGTASVISVEVPKRPADCTSDHTEQTWTVCGSVNVLFAKVDGTEDYVLFGGKGVDVHLWDLKNCSTIWKAKSTAKNSLGIFTPGWFTSATFLCKNDHRKFVAGTNSHEVRLYDISAQRKPVMSFDFRETPIKAVAEDPDGHTVYIGNGSGDLASVDIRTGKLLGCFLGKCSGSIRSIARHPDHPVIASCGLDSYLRLWDVKSRQLLSAVFLKQHLNCVVFDSHFSLEAAGNATPIPPQEEAVSDASDADEEEVVPAKRKKTAKVDRGSKVSKSKRKKKERS